MPILPQFSTVVRSNTAILPQFSHRSPVQSAKNVHRITVLSVRHARRDERVARRREKFAFYHSFEHPTRTKWRKGREFRSRICISPHLFFERPTGTKWRKGRSASFKICILLQFWAADTHEVTKGSRVQVKNLQFYHRFGLPTRTKWREGCEIHRCDPCAQTEKEYILRLFQRILISSLSLQSFL